MDRNLGAAQIATSSTDVDAYGYLYQWGRLTDGHQCRTSNVTTTVSTTDTPSTSSFINNNIDWRSPQNDNLWQGVNGINNPCPTGFRIPTKQEFDNEKTWSNATGAFNLLKLPVAGHRRTDGTFENVGANGDYWVSTISGTQVYFIGFNLAATGDYIFNRSVGASVRCIKN